MHFTKDVTWFKATVEPQLHNYSVSYRSFDSGDFGSLVQVVFEGSTNGGNIDYWGMGWLGIFLYDYVNDVEVINLLFEPSELDKSDAALEDIVSRLIPS